MKNIEIKSFGHACLKRMNDNIIFTQAFENSKEFLKET